MKEILIRLWKQCQIQHWKILTFQIGRPMGKTVSHPRPPLLSILQLENETITLSSLFHLLAHHVNHCIPWEPDCPLGELWCWSRFHAKYLHARYWQTPWTAHVEVWDLCLAWVACRPLSYGSLHAVKQIESSESCSNSSPSLPAMLIDMEHAKYHQKCKESPGSTL